MSMCLMKFAQDQAVLLTTRKSIRLRTMKPRKDFNFDNDWQDEPQSNDNKNKVKKMKDNFGKNNKKFNKPRRGNKR